MLFDKMSVYQSTGPILEETHYYPFGMTMAGISTVAPLKLANNYKYNGKLLNHHEFSDGTGLEWYSYGMREYDPQIGRFPQLDPLTDEFAALTPYQYASNDPIANIDLDGLEGVGAVGGLASKAAGKTAWLSEVVVTAAKPVTTSARFLQGLSAAARIENVASIGIHGLQIMGEAFGGWGMTKEVGSQITISEMNAIFPNAHQNIVQGFVKNFNKYSGEFGINDDITLAQFLAQTGTETWNGFTRLSENMNYSSESSLKSNFSIFKSSKYDVKDYVHNGDALAKLVYGVNKNGLDFRGRGVIQLTKKGNYKEFTDFYDKKFSSSIDFVAQPNLISENYKFATISGLWFFKTHVIDKEINMMNTSAVTRIITGPSKNGLSQRMNYFNRAYLVLAALAIMGIYGIAN